MIVAGVTRWSDNLLGRKDVAAARRDTQVITFYPQRRRKHDIGGSRDANRSRTSTGGMPQVQQLKL